MALRSDVAPLFFPDTAHLHSPRESSGYAVMARVIHWASVFFTVTALALLSTAILLIASDHRAGRELEASLPAISTEPALVMIGDYSEDEATRRSSLIDQMGREQLQSLRRKEAAAIRAYLNDFVLRR